MFWFQSLVDRNTENGNVMYVVQYNDDLKLMQILKAYIT